MELNVYYPTSPMRGVFPGLWSTYQDWFKENWLSLFPQIQTPKAPQLEVIGRLTFRFHTEILSPWVCRGLAHAVTISVSSSVQLPYSVQQTLFPRCHAAPLTLTIFRSPLPRALIEDIGLCLSRLGLNTPRSAHWLVENGLPSLELLITLFFHSVNILEWNHKTQQKQQT